MQRQLLLFKLIEQQLHPKMMLVDVVMDILEIKKSAAYSRIKGDKVLTVLEFFKLCETYPVPLEALALPNQQIVPFRYISLDTDYSENYLTYIKGLMASVRNLVAEKEKEVWFAADEIPIFHFMDFPELVQFKLFSFNRAVNQPQGSYDDFAAGLDWSSLGKIFNQIGSDYRRISSREIWTERTLDAFLKLIPYYKDVIGDKDPGLPVRLLDQLLLLLDKVEQWAVSGRKGDDGSGRFDLYLCPLDIGPGQMLTITPQRETVLLKLYTINNISTADPGFAEESHKWLKAMMDKSSHLTGASENKRMSFFRDMREKIHKAKTGLLHGGKKKKRSGNDA